MTNIDDLHGTTTTPTDRESAHAWLDFIDSKWCRYCKCTHMLRSQFDAMLELARRGADDLPSGGSG